MKALRRIAFSLLAIAFLGIAWMLVPLRISNPELNQITSLLVIWLVLVGLCIASAILPRRIWLRIALATPFGILAGAYPLLLFGSMLAGGPLKSYEILSSISLPSSKVIAYRTNMGATTDYHILISHEMPLVPGFVLVRDLHHGYHEYLVTLLLSQSGTIKATFQGLPVEKYVEEYTPRRYVIF